MGFFDSLFGLLGGSSAKTDRKTTLQGYGDLNNVFSLGMTQGKAGLAKGNATEDQALSDLGAPSSYYQKLLTGGRQGALSAVAPSVNAVNAQTDAAKRGLATGGTARGGGVATVGNQIDTEKRAATDTAITQARSGAAQGATGVAGVKAGIGATQLESALNLLGLGEKSAASLTADAIGSRMDSQALHDEASAKATSVAKGVLNILFSKYLPSGASSGGPGGG